MTSIDRHLEYKKMLSTLLGCSPRAISKTLGTQVAIDHGLVHAVSHIERCFMGGEIDRDEALHHLRIAHKKHVKQAKNESRHNIPPHHQSAGR